MGGGAKQNFGGGAVAHPCSPMATSLLRGPGPVDINIIADYWRTHLLLYAKMLKETEETIGFVVTFYHEWHFSWEIPGPLDLPAYAYR